MSVDASQLDALHALIAARKETGADQSYTMTLLAGGPALCARKFGEEAVETIVAALAGDRANLVSESADFLYHWLVLLTALDVSPEEVYAELARREGRSGLDEKAARKKPES